MTPAQNALLQRLVSALSQDRRIQALWLSGSLGKGEGDAWSDIDLVAQAPAAEIRACVADYRRGRPGLPEAVLAFEVHGMVVSVVTPDWERFDILFAGPDDIAKADPRGWRPLFGDTARPPAPATPPDADAPARVTATVTEFLRVLGLLPVAAGRQEWIAAQQGFDLLRRMLIDLMLEENGHGRAARGAKRLNGFLTAEQRGELEAIVPPRAARDAVIAANVDLARAFFARARPLAVRLAAEWPEAFEAATRRHLKATLSLDL
jgi:hypothetical protein